MASPLKLWLVLFLYLFSCNLLLLSWLFPVAQLAQGYEVGVFTVNIKTAYTGVYMSGGFGPACLYCEARTHDADCVLACGDFRTAAVSYFSTSLIVLILLLGSGVNLLAVASGCYCCLSLKFQFVHYLLLPVYLFSVLLYMLISGTLQGKTEASLLSGAVGMLGTASLLVLSLPLFCLLHKELKSPLRRAEDGKESELSRDF